MLDLFHSEIFHKRIEKSLDKKLQNETNYSIRDKKCFSTHVLCRVIQFKCLKVVFLDHFIVPWRQSLNLGYTLYSILFSKESLYQFLKCFIMRVMNRVEKILESDSNAGWLLE